MPASEFKSSCFNTVKRKASVEDAVEVWSSDFKCEDRPKRFCKWQRQVQQLLLHPSHEEQQSGMVQLSQEAFSDSVSFNNNNSLPVSIPPQSCNDCNVVEEMNHNSPAVQDQQQIYEQQHQLKNPTITEVLSQQPPRVPSPWPSQQAFHSARMDDHIMDLNEGTYNSTSSEMEVSCSAMESDCTSDSGQYRDDTRQPQHSPATEFCKNFCGGGELSPNSGRVRCYCKPSWEAMLDMKPYISDIY